MYTTRPIRKHVSQQLDRILRVAPLASIVLLITTLSATVAPLVTWRGLNLQGWAIIIALLVGAAVLVFANLWATRFDMVRSMRSAQTVHDPVQVYQFTPKERVVWQTAMLPQLQHQLTIGKALERITPDDELLRLANIELETRIARLTLWESLGYVPRDEYPPALQHYYWLKEASL